MLIKCPECKREISDKAKACIHCGYPLSETETNQNKKNSLYKIILTNYPPNYKVKTIRVVRETTGLGLAEAKFFVENLPNIIQKGLNYDKCIELQKLFTTYGAITEIEEDNESIEENKTLDNLNISSLENIKRCPKCGNTELTPLRRKWTLFGGFATNKIDMVCSKCGTVVK